MLRPRAVAPLVTAAALLARAAHADPSAAELANARHAFEAAVGLEGEQRWAEAATRLREAIAVKDTPGLRFHLAKCEAEQGRLLAASAEYERATDLLHQGAKAPDVQKLLGPAAEAVKQRIPRITLEIPGEVRDPSVAIDGKAYTPSDLALGVPLDPGRHGLRVTAPGRRAFERGMLLKEGEQLAIRAELPRNAALPVALVAPGAAAPSQASPSSASPVAPAASETSGSSAKLYLIIGESVITVAGLAMGIGYRSAVSSANDRIDSAQLRIDTAAPGDPTACSSMDAEALAACSDLQGAIDDHDRASRLSTVGFVSAGVGAAALLTTVLVYPSRSAKTGSGLSVRPLLGLGHVGLLGRF